MLDHTDQSPSGSAPEGSSSASDAGGNPWREETRWRPLSDAVASLKRQVEAAYFRGDTLAADQCHDDLLSAEWRLRQAERRDR